MIDDFRDSHSQDATEFSNNTRDVRLLFASDDFNQPEYSASYNCCYRKTDEKAIKISGLVPMEQEFCLFRFESDKYESLAPTNRRVLSFVST
jgi:hypothetical protein